MQRRKRHKYHDIERNSAVGLRAPILLALEKEPRSARYYEPDLPEKIFAYK
jgi:hypothetical protein